MTLSVVMCTFNGARYVAAQLDSLRLQTCLPDELVISDDGSTDSTLEIINMFRPRAPFEVRVLQKDARLGYRENFMFAAEASRGDYVAFCDQDDIWRSDKIERVLRTFSLNRPLMVYHRLRIVGPQGELLGHSNKGPGPGSLSGGKLFSPWRYSLGLSQTFDRRLLRYSKYRNSAIDFYQAGESYAHDQWIGLLASTLGDVSFIDDDLADYRQHGGNVEGAPSMAFLPRLVRLFTRHTAPSDYNQLKHVAESLVPVFRGIQQTGDEFADNAGYAKECFLALSLLEGQRARLVDYPSVAGRLSAWLMLARSGVYGRNTGWTLPLIDAALDLSAVASRRRSRPMVATDRVVFRSKSVRLHR